MVILRPFVDRFADRQTLQTLASCYPELDIDSVETCLAFLRATADVQAALDTHFARYGLSMGKFTLLMQLLQADEQGLTPSECAERAGVTRATITGLLDGLEREGLVKRQPCPSDRRMLRFQYSSLGADERSKAKLVNNQSPQIASARMQKAGGRRQKAIKLLS